MRTIHFCCISYSTWPSEPKHRSLATNTQQTFTTSHISVHKCTSTVKFIICQFLNLKCDAYISTHASYPTFQVRAQPPKRLPRYRLSVLCMCSSSLDLTRAEHFGGSDPIYQVCAQLTQLFLYVAWWCKCPIPLHAPLNGILFVSTWHQLLIHQHSARSLS